MLTRWLLRFLGLLHFLPMPLLRRLGAGLGALLYLFGQERRHVVMTNLRLCFPKMESAEYRRLARQHYRWLGCSFLDRGVLYNATPQRLERLITVQGGERLAALSGQPVILLTAHFVGTEAALTRLSMLTRIATIYSNQKNPVFHEWLLAGRSRFGNPLMLSRLENIRQVVRAIKSGLPFLYLPDMDFGPRDAVFVPFFGTPAATVTALPRLAQLSGAIVLPIVTRMTEAGYEVEIGEPWQNFPGTSVLDDTRRLNAYIEAEVLRQKDQYYWVHKRFKTRPTGEMKVY